MLTRGTAPDPIQTSYGYLDILVCLHSYPEAFQLCLQCSIAIPTARMLSYLISLTEFFCLFCFVAVFGFI